MLLLQLLHLSFKNVKRCKIPAKKQAKQKLKKTLAVKSLAAEAAARDSIVTQLSRAQTETICIQTHCIKRQIQNVFQAGWVGHSHIGLFARSKRVKDHHVFPKGVQMSPVQPSAEKVGHQTLHNN